MQYFKSLIPTITDNTTTYYDMFFNLDITNVIPQEYLTIHQTKDYETLQDIAWKYYKEPRLWWLICLLNDFKDPIFDIAKSEEYIQQEAAELATINPLFWTGTDSDLFWTGLDTDSFWYDQADFLNEYEILADENDSIRDIQILKPEYLQTVLTKIIEQVGNV